MMSMKKAALELDAALPTRRALGTWAAVEIMADVDTTPGGALIAKKPSDKNPQKQKPATLPRPNSSFLHSFINSYNQSPSEIAAKAKDSINNSVNDAKKDPPSHRPSEAKNDTSSCNPSETRNEDRVSAANEIKVHTTNAAIGIDSLKSTVLSGEGAVETVVMKSAKDHPPVNSSSSASQSEKNDKQIAHEKSLEFPGKEERFHPTSSSLHPPSSREKEEGQAMNPDDSTVEDYVLKDQGMLYKGGEEEEEGPLTSVAVSVVGGGSEEEKGEMAEEEGFCTGCSRISPSPSLRSLQTPSPFSHLSSVSNSFPKKPSFRVVRRRDSRRKEARRHHAMAVLPSSKVATLASKFNALILEKEGSPSQSKTGPRLYRTLPSQKTSGAVVLRRRGFAYIPGESDLRRQGRKRSEEAGSRKSEGELPKRSPSSLSTSNIPVALKTQRSSVTSVKDAIRIFEDNLRTRPPVPRKPKLDGNVSPKPSEVKKVLKPNNDLPRLLVATKIEVYHPESVSSVIEAMKSKQEVIEIEAIDDNNSDEFVTSENSYVNLVQSTASEVPIEEPKALSKDSEDNDGGYEPVSPVPLSDPPPVPGMKPIPSVKPNSSFLWGSQPILCPASSSLSSSLKKLSLPEKPGSQTSECLDGYDSLEDEEDGYDDIGPPSEPKAASEGLGPECEVDSLGGYESFSVPESESRDSKDVGVVGVEGRGVGSMDGRGRKGDRLVYFYEGVDSVYDDVRSMNAAAIKAETTSVSNCYESIYCGEGRVCLEESRTGAPRDRRSVSSEESRGGSVGGSDSLSGIELKSNSLYGRCGSTLSDSGESHNSEVDGPHEVLSYQLTSLGGTVKGCGEAERRSDTSDDWVDVEASDAEDDDNDSEGAVVVFRERIPRGRGGPKWSKKVRREYSRRSRKSREGVEMEAEQHHYETLYELVGSTGVRERQETCTVVVQDKPQHVQQPNVRQHALPYENLSDDDFDSFDSDMSDEFDDQVPTKELPSIPADEKIPTSPGAPTPGNNTNGITKKMAEVAGKKMQEFRKNWSIRKHDLTRSLKRIGQKSGSEYTTTPIILSHPQPPLPPTPDSPPPLPPSRPPPSHPPPPLPPERSISNVCPPLPNVPTSNPPPPLNKSVSSGNLSGRKYWSFKSRFGRRASASTSSLQRQSSTSPSTSPSSSTFYITGSVNADTGLSETSDSSTKAVPVEQSPGNRIRWSISGDDMLDKPKAIEEKRKSISSKPPVTRRSSMRPRGPPPPPPNAQNLSPNVQNGENRNGAPSPMNVSPTYAPPSTASSSSSSSSPYAFHCNRSSPTTSWFTDVEDGLQRAGSLDENVNKKNRENKMSTVSWYADIGLWTSKNADSIQENGRHTDTSDSSSSNVASPDGSVVNGQFIDEPLYQFYTAAVAKSVAHDMDYDSDGYEEIGKFRTEKHQSPRPKAMDLVRHKEGCRTLWCQIPEVLASGLLDTFNAHQKKIQEAKFEVVTSEASYLKSLNILVSHFVESQSLNDENLVSKSDREILFSNVLPVKHCSERFMAELERCWQEDILLLDICEIIRRHAEKYFKVYVNYCSNQVHLDRALHRLKKSSQFMEIINTLESHPVCQSLSLHSFLMLPMQRVTRLPLLVDAILRRMSKEDSKYGACQVALATLNKVVQDCNEGARHAERLEEMKVLSQQLDFREVGSPSLLSGGRWLVRKGELVHLHWRDDPSSLLGVASTPAVSSVSSISTVPVVSQPSISTSKLTFGRKMVKQPLFLFLFTDLLVITKKKSEEHYVVLDFCLRNLVEIVSGGLDGLGGPSSLQQLPPKYFSEGGKNIFLLSMLQNHENRTVEMVLSSSQESDKERWLEAFTPASSDNPDEQVYEEWDCPQVAAVHHYVAQQPDELSLEISDVVNVLRKLSDGWYLGERIRDGEKGWFPANHCTEIASSHVRAKNLRQRYRLLALSGDYLEQQRRERALAKAAKKKKSKKESKKE